MIVEKKEIEELKNEIDKSSAALISFLEERLQLSNPKFVEYGNPNIEINKNELNRLASGLKTYVDLLLKLKAIKNN